MKKVSLFLMVIVLMAGALNAQENGARRSIRVGYGYLGGALEGSVPIYDFVEIYSGSAITINADLWNIGKGMTAGFYVGGGLSGYVQGMGTQTLQRTLGMHWGVDASWHLLSYIGSTTDKWDISLNGSLGTYWSRYATPQSEYAASVTITFYPLKHWGIFVENGWGKFVYGQDYGAYISEGNTILRAGISYCF